jgi:hypothetical protein
MAFRFARQFSVTIVKPIQLFSTSAKMPSSKGKPTDPKLREKVKEEVKNETNKDGGGKGQWSAWKVGTNMHSLLYPLLTTFQGRQIVQRV